MSARRRVRAMVSVAVLVALALSGSGAYRVPSVSRRSTFEKLRDGGLLGNLLAPTQKSNEMRRRIRGTAGYLKEASPRRRVEMFQKTKAATSRAMASICKVG